MKSIDKLRKTLKDCTKEAGIEPDKFDTYWITAKACDMLIDEIEAEIAERYMLLPCDYDGEPLHIGDITNEGKIARMIVRDDGESSVYVYKLPNVLHEFACYEVEHVKPRTLEDVLTEMLDRNTDGVGLREFNRDFGAFVAHYADEIRELMSGDAE